MADVEMPEEKERKKRDPGRKRLPEKGKQPKPDIEDATRQDKPDRAPAKQKSPTESELILATLHKLSNKFDLMSERVHKLEKDRVPLSKNLSNTDKSDSVENQPSTSKGGSYEPYSDTDSEHD